MRERNLHLLIRKYTYPHPFPHDSTVHIQHHENPSHSNPPPLDPRLYNHVKRISADYHQSFYPHELYSTSNTHTQPFNGEVTVNSKMYTTIPHPRSPQPSYHSLPPSMPNQPLDDTQQVHSIMVTDEELQELIEHRRQTRSKSPSPSSSPIPPPSHPHPHSRSQTTSHRASHSSIAPSSNSTSNHSSSSKTNSSHHSSTNTNTSHHTSTTNTSSNHSTSTCSSSPSKLNASKSMKVEDTGNRPYSQFQHLCLTSDNTLPWYLSLRR